MRTYIGTKVIKSRQLTRGEYNQLRGWTLPENENPHEIGYLVEYEDHHVTWTPKETFEMTYTDIEAGVLNFGQALSLLKQGFNVTREDWGSKRRFIYLVHSQTIPYNNLRNQAKEALAKTPNNEGLTVTINSHIDMKTFDDCIIIGWTASQADMLAEDWKVIL